MKKIFKKLTKALKKVLAKKANYITLSEKIILGTTGICIISVLFFGGKFLIEYKIKSDKAEAFDELKNTTQTSQTTSSYTTIEDEEKKQALKDLKDMQDHMSSLGTIRLFQDNIMITHGETVNEGKGLFKKYINIKIKADTIFSAFQESSDIEFVMDNSGKKIIALIDRPTINEKDVYMDQNGEYIVLEHPEPTLITENDSMSKVEELAKRTILNENVKGRVHAKEIMQLEQKVIKTFPKAAHTQINDKIMNDAKFKEKYENIALSVIENIYNPRIQSHSVVTNGSEKNVHLPKQTPVEARFKN